MNKLLDELKKEFGDQRIKTEELMKIHTSFKAGGPASYFLPVDKPSDIVKLVNISFKHDVPLYIIGGGTNSIISEKGLKGIVIKNNCRRFDILGVTGRVLNQQVGYEKAIVNAESGVILNQLVRFTIDQGLSGLEYQLGLPGTIGGAVYMNSCYPKENIFVGDYVYKAQIVTPDGVVKEVDGSYFQFSYNYSALQKTKDILLSVQFLLKKDDPKALWARAMEALEYRKNSYPKERSVGLTYRNIFKTSPVNLGRSSSSALTLFTKSHVKGKRYKEVMISESSPHFILNMGEGRDTDVVILINTIKDEIEKKNNVKLSYEVTPLGV